MEIDTIKHQLNGYFINRMDYGGDQVSETLCKKIDGDKYETLDNVMTPSGQISASDLLLRQINNQILNPSVCICSLKEILPVINGRIWELHENREKEIEKHIDCCSAVETDENEFLKGKYIVKWKRPRGFAFGIVDGDKLTEVDGDIFDDQQRKTAVRIQFPKLLRRALKDDMSNQYEDECLQEIKKYNDI